MRITSSFSPWMINTFPLNRTIQDQLSKCCLTMLPKHPKKSFATFFIVSKGEIKIKMGDCLLEARQVAPPEPIERPIMQMSSLLLFDSAFTNQQKFRESSLILLEIKALHVFLYVPYVGYSKAQKVILVAQKIGCKKNERRPISSPFPWKQMKHFLDCLLFVSDICIQGTLLPSQEQQPPYAVKTFILQPQPICLIVIFCELALSWCRKQVFVALTAEYIAAAESKATQHARHYYYQQDISSPFHQKYFLLDYTVIHEGI